MHADTCTNAYMHTHGDTDACMDGCTHIIIQVHNPGSDGPALHIRMYRYTCKTHTLMETQTLAWTDAHIIIL